jgi:hypothetical protein
MLKDVNGNKLFRKVVVKIFFPDDVLPMKTISQRAGPHQGFGPAGIDDILMSVADQLDSLYPWWDFKMVELAPEGRTARYSFTFAGYRSTSATLQDNPNAESSTLIPETADSNPPTAVA